MLFFWTLVLLAPYANAAKLLKVPLSSKLLPPGSPSTKPSTPDAPLQNAAVKVVTPVQCGNSQTFKDVLVDTGSAILWVGGEQPYQPGPSTQVLNSTFGVGYGIGGVSGTAFRDTVVIGEASGSAQIIGAANVTNGFNLVRPIDGILGLGPSGSNAGDVSGFNSTPTFVETLVADKSIDQPLFGIYISPLGQDGIPEGTGEITFGGVDPARIRGDITWVDQTPPLDFHWEFNVSSFSFGGITLNTSAPARTDTGALAIGIPFDELFAIRDAFNGTIAFDNSSLSSLLSFPSNATATLPSLDFTLGNTMFSIPPWRYIVPRSLYPSLNVTDNPALSHTWIASAGPGSYQFGQKWLENAYSVYDMANHRIGFAHLA
ncbi:acid protease [Gautieria morchelliformis]|nr:acid protease [Gautieria morchelliformis]